MRNLFKRRKRTSVWGPPQPVPSPPSRPKAKPLPRRCCNCLHFGTGSVYGHAQDWPNTCYLDRMPEPTSKHNRCQHFTPRIEETLEEVIAAAEEKLKDTGTDEEKLANAANALRKAAQAGKVSTADVLENIRRSFERQYSGPKIRGERRIEGNPYIVLDRRIVSEADAVEKVKRFYETQAGE